MHKATALILAFIAISLGNAAAYCAGYYCDYYVENQPYYSQPYYGQPYYSSTPTSYYSYERWNGMESWEYYSASGRHYSYYGPSYYPHYGQYYYNYYPAPYYHQPYTYYDYSAYYYTPSYSIGFAW